jgi:dihydrofolate synthase / folylpolyglutamate synthase
LSFADDEYTADYSLADRDGNQVFNFRKNGVLSYPSLILDLPGLYQRLNVPAVLKTVDLLRGMGWQVPEEAVYKGLSDVKLLTGLQGRWQVLGSNPRIVCDTGHNEEGIKLVVDQINQTPYKRLHIVFGVVSDKDPDKVLALLPKDASYYFCKADIPRAMDEKVLAGKAAEFGLSSETFSSVSEAYEAARSAAGPDDFIFIGVVPLWWRKYCKVFWIFFCRTEIRIYICSALTERD